MSRTVVAILIGLLMPGLIVAAERRLGEITVTARRPVSEIGVVMTKLDSASLKDNVSLSMADVLTFNTSVYVKNYGRGTQATVAMRGTSPSHTRVTWNGMNLSSPLLGMTDFSTIPSYFIDHADVFHGSGSLNQIAGGLGGLVALSTVPDIEPGLHAQYVQGIGSFKTFDEFARVTWSNRRWKTSTRLFAGHSANDFMFTNHDRKENVYDSDHNIVAQYYPRQRNRNGAFTDYHAMQEVWFDPGRHDRAGLSAWYMSTNREIPFLTTDYGADMAIENRQREQTLRAVGSWDHSGNRWKMRVRGGWTHSWVAYDYSRGPLSMPMTTMSRTRSHLNTIFGRAEGEYNPVPRVSLTASVAVNQHIADSRDRSMIDADGHLTTLGYREWRAEISAAASARWQPLDGYGVALVMRHESMGGKSAPLIPALMVDALVSRRANVTLKGSVSRNYRFPSLNDLYLMPGGNPDLKSESGITYDLAVACALGDNRHYSLSGSLGWFDSYIDNWILWLPTPKGYFTPRNVKKVHSYGIELNINMMTEPLKGLPIDLSGSLSWTPSINRGGKMSEGDRSTGRQLPYVPRVSASLTGHLTWRRLGFLYKWCYYSRRYTMSSNDLTFNGYLPPYFMSNIAVEYNQPLRPADIQLKLSVNNLFNEDYLSVLSRPMPGINFELYIGITPRFKQTKKNVNHEK